MTTNFTFCGKTFEELENAVKERTTRSAWSRGVEKYAMELLCDLAENVQGGYYSIENAVDYHGLYISVKEALLNGAKDWNQYSWGGCSLVYDGDIAERLCAKSELKKTKGGERKPNSQEEWLDVQAMALSQAAKRVWNVLDNAWKECKH